MSVNYEFVVNHEAVIQQQTANNGNNFITRMF